VKVCPPKYRATSCVGNWVFTRLNSRGISSQDRDFATHFIGWLFERYYKKKTEGGGRDSAVKEFSREYLIVDCLQVSSNGIAMADKAAFNFTPWIAPALSGLIGFIGIIVGAWLTGWRERAARRSQFVKQQLEEFYSPLVGLRLRIRAKSELREKIHAIASDVGSARYQGITDPRVSQEITQKNDAEFGAVLNYSETQLREELLPDYRRMLDLFTEKMWLAEKSTRLHYPKLVEFVEIWNRGLDKTLAREVIDKLEHSEGSLRPLYEDLEFHLECLRTQLSKGKG
jgi:hypothetical protein